MLFYRGDNRKPEVIKRDGLAPWVPGAGSCQTLFGTILQSIQTNGGGTAAGFSQYLRSKTRNEATATSRDTVGCSYGDYIYQINIPNVLLYRLGDTALGADVTASFANTANIDQDYIVVDNATLSLATVIGVGHNASTFEVTFYKAIPPANITHYAYKTQGNAAPVFLSMAGVVVAQPKFETGALGVSALKALWGQNK